MRVLMVCLGNICRSPAAEVVLRHMAAQGGRATIEVDSCGTSGWHQGQSPYGPMITAAAARGYELRGLRARKLHRDDFTRFDLIVALDQSILHDIEKLRPATSTIPAQLLNIPAGAVPDPYYTRDFDQALDLIETGCRSLLDGM